MDASSNSAAKPDCTCTCVDAGYVVGSDPNCPRHAIPKRAAERCPCWSPAGKQCVLDAGHGGYHAHGNDQVPDTTTSWTDCYPPPGHDTRNHTPTWRNGYLEGWRCAMESAKGGDWSAEYPDGW